jgi:uncharacterized membrane protein
MSISRQDRKRRQVEKILDNEFYRPDSGMHQNLSEALMQLSLFHLVNLNLILDLKLADARREGALNHEHVPLG